MHRVAILAICLFMLAGCVAGMPAVVEGPPETATSPIRGIVNSEGKGDAQVVYVPFGAPAGGTYPVTAKFRWSHDATAVIQPYPPYLIIDGGGELIVEPIPGEESRAQYLLDAGAVQIQRAGRVDNRMNRPGSIPE
jgi:hypothetical protein